MSDDPRRPQGGDPHNDQGAPQVPPSGRPAGTPRGPAPEGEGIRIITAEELADAQPGPGAQQRPAPMPGRPAAAAPPGPVRPAPAGTPPGPPQDADRVRPISTPPVVPIPATDQRGPGASGTPESEPLLSVGPPSGEVQLPHWTEPPTGEVPSVVANAAPGSDLPRSAAGGPRWRNEDERWDADEDLVGDLAHDDSEDIGALRGEDPGPAWGTRGAAPGPQGAPGGQPGAPSRRPVPPRSGERGPMAERPGGPPASGGTGGRNMGQAIAVGVGLAAVALVLARLGAPWFMILVEVVIVLAAAEYLSTLRRAGLEPPTLLGLVAVAALPLAAYARGDAAIPMVLFLLLVFSMVWFLAGAGPGRPVRDIGTMFLAVVHVGVLGAFAALILRLGPLGGADVDQGVSILILAVVAVVGYDVGGLFVGSKFGRTPLSPASPNKTREGLLGGIAVSVAAVVLAVVVPVIGLTTLSFVQAVVFGLACAVAAFVGDLSESLIKRDLGVKDMGHLLPGHGGVLDRFDGLLFVLPTAYYIVLVIFG